ncbi:MAG: SdrD B-like domain-containing protein [Saprospiraceae bacterium]
MKIRNLGCALVFFGIFLFQNGFAQITTLDYQIRYNTTTCRWDCYIIINGGSATTAVHRAQSNAQYSIVVPTGSTVTIAQNFMPIQNNQTYMGTTPMIWQKGSFVGAPAAEPQSDFHSIVPTLVPSSFFNNLTAGDTVKLFALNINPMPNCAAGVRIFRNGIDPPSSAPGMGGGDFSNGYTVGGTAQRYRANLPQINPPPPVLSAVTTCSQGIEVDLTATTNACQTPLTYQWSGPNGYTGTTQDVNINPSTPLNAGLYEVTVTDSKGCTSTTNIVAVSKPNAGSDINGCVSTQYTISGINPNTGTWSALPSNPSGATLTPGVGGQANATFNQNASGAYNFRYNTGACSDTVQINISQVDAGLDPPNVSCYISGSASLAATGNGSWSIGVGSAGTANFGNSLDPNSSVSGFSASGTYFFVWTVGNCSDTATLVVGEDCSCAITDNNLSAVNPSTYCGATGNIVISGSSASPAAGNYLWIYSLNGGSYSNASGTNNAQNYTTTILNQGTHRFRRVYSLPSEPGCIDTSNVVLITVNNTPGTPLNLVADPNPVCTGQSVALSVTNVVGVTYTWTASSVNAGLVASGLSSTTMLPLVAGSYTISVTAMANGCTSTAATTVVQVFETPPTPNGATVSATNPTTCNGNDGFISFSGLSAFTTYTINYTKNGSNQSSQVTTDGSGGAILIGLTAGTYGNFVFVSANGCPSGEYVGPVALIDPNAPPVPSNLQASPNPTCQNVTINLSVTNNPGATYTWSSTSPGAGLGSSTSSTNTMLPTTSGFFNIMVTQTVAGCTSPSASLGVSVNASPPTPNAGTVTFTNPTTCGGTNGTITLSGYVSNTSFGIRYFFNSVEVNVNITSAANGNIVITGLAVGTYTNFSVTNISGCSSGVYPGPVVLTNPSTPSAPANLTGTPNPVCLTNSVVLSVTNTPGATYTWSANSANAGLNVSTSSNNSMLPTVVGTYAISVTQTIAGCTSLPSSISVVANQNSPTPISAIGSNPTSCSGTNGFITLAGLGSFNTFTVNYLKNGNPVSGSFTSNNSGDLVITGLTSGVYTNFSVTNAFNCTSGTLSGPVILSDPNAPPVPANIAANPNPVCAGVLVNLSVTNNPGATYVWSASNGNAGLVPSSTSTTTMTSNVAATYTISVVQIVGGCTSPPATLQVVVNSQPATPVAGQFSFTNPTTCGGSNGSISISGLTPNTNYTLQYSKNNNPQSSNLTSNGSGVLVLMNLTAGSYNNFRLTNDSGCQSGTSVHSVSLTDPGAPSIPQNLTAIPNPVCLGNVVNLSVDNTPGATFTWTASSTDAGLVSSSTNTTTMTAIVASSYVISVIQTIAGCTSGAALITVVVNANPPTLSNTNVTGVNPTTCGGNNGEIVISGLVSNTTYTLNYNKGISPLTANITADGSGVARLIGQTAGTYSNFRIINVSGCPSNIYPGPVTLIDPNAPGVPTNLQAIPNPTCLGTTVNLSVNGEVGALFNWSASSAQAGLQSSSSNTNTMTALSANTYIVSVTQTVNGCTSSSASTSITINSNPPSPVVLSSLNPSVCAGNDGSISFSGYVSSQNYTIIYQRNGIPASANLIANGSGVLVLTGLNAGVYSNFSVTNAGNCSSNILAGPVNLDDPNSPPAPAALTAIPNPACLGVTINLSVTNNPNAVYSWTISSPDGGLGSSNTSTNVMNPSLAGNYTVQVSQNVAGCTSPNATVLVVVNNNPPTPDGNNVSKTDPTCDLSNGSISIFGLTPNVAFTVNYLFNGSPSSYNGATNASGVISITNLVGGIYTNFSLTSAEGCNSGIYPGPVNLINPGLPSPPNGINVTPSFICVKNNVEISVNPTQGAVYSWIASSPLVGLIPSSTEVTSLVPTAPGLYTVSVTQTLNGCTSPPTSTTVEVRGDCYNPDFDVTYVNVTVNGNVSSNDGIINANYSHIQSLIGNPSNCIPTLLLDGSYSFTCGIAGVYQFEVNSCSGSCEIVPLVITVLEENSNNKPPVVNHDYARTKMNVPIQINILANDKCQNSLTCSLNTPIIITPPTKGLYNLVNNTYTPNSNFVGIDSFRYEVCQTPTSTPINCQRTWVYITVISTQAANVTNAMDDYAQTPWNTPINKSVANGLLANDTDPEGNSQSVVPITSSIPGVGDLTVLSNGSYTFTPEAGFYGPYAWVYDVCDNNVTSACDRATLHLLVDSENQASRVGNFVWLDANANGIQDLGEVGMPNCQVRLYNNSGIMVGNTMTDLSGQYMFDDVQAGDYYVKVTTPTDYVYSPPLAGNDVNLDSDVTGTMGSGTTNFFSVQPGQDRLDCDAGMYRCSKVSGFLWYDYHKNDLKDNFENGINGLFVFLWRKVNGTFVIWTQATTGQQPGTASEDGYFEFPCIPPGEYYIQVDLPLIGLVRVKANVGNNPNKDSDLTNANGHMTTNTFTLMSGQNKTDLGGGFYEMAIAGNLVWIDTNVNGVQDLGEPKVEGVVVEARDPQTHVIKGTAVTNSDGEYYIDYLERTDVYLKFRLPSSYQNYSRTFARVGSDAINSDVDNSFGSMTTRAVSMEPSITNENIDLGIVQGALPVSWVDVQVFKNKENEHVISWETANEVNLSHYVIERSLNNATDFNEIDHLIYPQSGHNINKIYSALDRDVSKIGVYYYRIKQVDLDGRYSFSKTVSIRNNRELNISVFPSPAVQNTNLSIQLPSDMDVTVELFDVSSRKVATLSELNRFEKGVHEFQFDVSNLKSGVYTMTIKIDDQVITEKLVILEK